MKMNTACPENRRNRTAAAVVALVASLMIALLTAPVQAAIVYIGSSSGGNNALPLDGSAGALTIPVPPGVSAGRALIASIAARPRSMTVTVPAGWILMTATDQPAGGVSTAPGGMTLLTYYKIATVSEPASYTWTFANPTLNQGGSAVGGILVFSGIDTSASPINVWSARLTPNGLTHATNSITPTVTNTMIVSSISYLSASSFANPTGIAGLTERLDVSAPVVANAIGTTLQMATAPWATATATGNSQAVAASSADTGVGHLMALRPSLVDTEITMTRSGPLIPGGSASYTLTVTNNGINPEPGPLTVVDTLPAGLSYASSSGGWTCNVAGQVVTCTLAGALAAGATAPALVLNVNVSAGASGTLTNTATVSGTGGDGNTANNTAVDSYTIPVQTYAYYAMDEAAWTGAANEVLDSSGNNRHATALGGITTLLTPASGSKGDTCRGANIPNNTTTATIQAVNTGIDVNSLGNAGTISFWYRLAETWNANNRQLFDATTVNNRWFFLTKRNNRQLRFVLTDSANNNIVLSYTAPNFAANTWVHIAVTWNMPANQYYMYVNGAQVANSTSGSSGALHASINTLYLGDNRSGVIGQNGTRNSANGAMDEARLYASALTAAQVAADMNATHACVSVDHYELSLAASSITCLPTTVTVMACANNSSPCTSPYTPASGTTADLTTLGATLGSGTVTFNASGVATTTLSYPGAADGTSASVTLSGEDLPAANSRQCCQGGSCVVANSCATTFNTAGFIFSDTAGGAAATIPAQSAGVSSGTYFLRGVRTSSTTQACEAALTGANTVNFAYECNNPTTCYGANLMSVNGGSATTIARNDNGSVSSYLPVNMTFDANGNAPFTFNYSDAGQVTLHASKPAGGSLLSALSGTSNAFVVKPHHFDLSAIKCTTADAANCAPGALPSGNNPGAANAAGASFIQAGSLFSVTVTARDVGGNLTRNYGKESTPESVRLVPTLVDPTGAGTSNPAVAYTTGFGAFTNGVATGTDFKWNEVGIITLTPGIGDGNYLGAGDVSGNVSGNVGRFTPHHFEVTTIAACGPVGTKFNYSGQPFTVTATACAAGSPCSMTSNYHGPFGFAKDTIISNAGDPSNFTNNTLAAANFINSTRIQTNVTYTFPTPPGKDVVPLLLTLRAIDTDNVSSAGYTEETAEIRSGRLRLINAYGSELVALTMPMRIEYFSTDGWVTNTADTCTTLGVGDLDLQNTIDNPAQGTNLININAGPPVKSTTVTPFSPFGGAGSLSFSAPTAGGYGYADARIDLSGDGWLKYDWDGDSTEDDPVGRATFGLYRGSPRHIYQRERY